MDCFHTINKASDDIAKYLKQYFNYELSDKDNITAETLFDTLKNHMPPFSFADFLKQFILQKYPKQIETGNPNELKDNCIKYCTSLFKKNGLINCINIFSKDKNIFSAELMRKQVKNWFGDVMPSRASIFLMSFAFQLSCEELSEFLVRGIHDRDINFKDPAETAACYCLKNNKDYFYVCDLIKRAGKYQYHFPTTTFIFTQEYKDIYDKIKTEEETLQFISKLIYEDNDTKFSITVHECYNELIEAISKNAAMDKLSALESESNIIHCTDHISWGTIERYIYSYIPIKYDDGHYKTDTYALYSNGNIAGKQSNYLKDIKWFFSTLLRRADMQKMYEGKKIISRDTILTLAFFIICEDNFNYSTYEYISEINEYLNFCRYDQVNFSYPYDLFLFMCLQTDDPISCFRRIWQMSWIK